MRTNLKHSGRIERGPALQKIAGYAYAYRQVWDSACKHDGIEPDSKFVVFSDDNPFTQFIGPALQRYREAVSVYQAGGYVF